MASLPPICLRGYFITSAVNVGGNPNRYTLTINQIQSQRYSSSTNTSLFYTGNDVQVGMYASSDINGKVFRIISLTTKSTGSITGTFEDIDGLNKRFDSGGSGAGNPSDNFGYIFQLNSEGLPLLTRVDDALSQTFTDSIMARFLYDRNSVRHVGQYRSIQLFARGTGRNVADPNNGGEPYARRVVLNETIISEESGDTTKRGLYLTILNATNFSTVSTTQYNTAGTTNSESGNLGTALNLMTRQQIGILTSYREWESKISNGALISAALRLGLTKLATFTDTSVQGRPYAAIFYGGGLDTTTGTHDVIERMESNDSDAPLATIAATLITDGNFVSIVGANSTNALYSANSNVKDPVVVITPNNKMGLGTTNPLGKLTIKGIGDETSAIVMLNGSGNGLTRPISGGVVSNEIIGLSDIFTSENRSATDAGQLRLSAGGGTSAGTKSYVDMYGYAGGPPDLGFYVAIGTRGTERLRIDQDGNVGIGTVPDTALSVANQLKLDVNGYVRGKGSIVNTVLQQPAGNNDDWIGYTDAGANAINYKYTPIQSGAVNVVIHGGLELALLNGYGTDNIDSNLFAIRDLFRENSGSVLFWAPGIIIPYTGVNNDTFIQNFGIKYNLSKITIPSSAGVPAGNVGTFTITNVITEPTPFLFSAGHYIYYTNSSQTTTSTVNMTTPTIQTGYLKRYFAQYLSGNSYSSSYQNLNSRSWRVGSTIQDAVYVRIATPTTFRLRVEYSSGDATFKDTPAYKNAYIIIHEISNS